MSFSGILGLIRIVRPSNVLIAGLSIFVGVWIFGRGKIDLINLALIAGIAGALIDAGGNVINDFFDVEIDRVNKPHRPIPSGLVSKESALIVYFVLTVEGLLVASFLNTISFIIAFLSAIVIFLYSYRIKKIPLVGNFTVAFMTGLAFVFAGSVVENVKDAFFPFVFALLVNFGREVIKDIEDIEGDIRGKIKTFPIVYGVDQAVGLVVLVFVALILISFVPYLLGIYNSVYMLIILLVDVGLVFVMFSLIRDRSKHNLNRLSNVLKLEMLIGLSAIYFGSLWR